MNIIKTFLIQTSNNQVQHDFSFHLIKSIEFINWKYSTQSYDYKFSEIPLIGDYIPIGSLEFVFEFLKINNLFKEEHLKPINIPKELNKKEFLGRKIYFAKKENILLNTDLFVKSNTRYKYTTQIISNYNKESIPEDEYLVSELIEMESEWRAFIHNGDLVGLKNYLGDFTLFPDVSKIKEMIKQYKSSPQAFTLDIAVNTKGTFIIEVHPFVSCGLYGFNDYNRIPQMFIQGFNYLKK